MKKPLKVIYISIALIFLILFAYILCVSLRTNYNSEIPKETPCSSNDHFDLYPHLVNWDKTKENFPYKVFLDSANRCNVISILEYLTLMDSINSDFRSNRQIISIALTDSLQARIASSVLEYKPDSLIRILQWIEKFNQAEKFDPSNAKLFRVINMHWLNFIANKLRTYYDMKHNLKYDYKFKYLESVCRSKNYAPPIGNTDFEKVIFNLSESNFSYLFSKFWHDTGFIYKIIGFILVSITAYGYYCIIRVHFLNRNK